jgi:molybdate transport system ATP-binding protein
MSSIRLKHAIQKGEFCLDVDTQIPATGITGVFGESGSGKTTLLRCIAGLDGSQRGSPPVHERRIGFVFQVPQLFSHLSVQKNIEYGMRRNPGTPVAVNEIARLLEVEGLLDRSVNELSGGEAQRVSIARVLCQSPRLILMDEPLSALDERRRNEVLPYLDCLHAETSVPIIYVSHNIEEICRLSDHLLAVIAATQARYDEEYDLTLFSFSGGELWVAGRHESTPARLRISASDISLSRVAAEATTILNILPAVIEATSPETAATELVRLRLGDDTLVARITRRSLQQLKLRSGDDVFVQIKSVTVRR